MTGLEITAIVGLISALAPVVGDLVGQALGRGDKEEAERLLDQARAQFNIPIPSIDELAAKVGASRMEKVQADPVAVEAQRRALQELQQLGAEGSDNIAYRAAMNRATQDANREANARDASLRQDMAARGLGGSGLEYATRAIAGQGAADRLASAGFDAAAEGRRQALQALQSGGALAGRVRDQSFDEGAMRARAGDEIERFNALQRSGAYRDRFGAQMQRGTALANIDTNRANIKTGQAAQTQQQFANYGSGAGQAAATIGQAYNEERRRRAQSGGY